MQPLTTAPRLSPRNSRYPHTGQTGASTVQLFTLTLLILDKAMMMRIPARLLSLTLTTALLAAGSPASAQFFWSPPDLSGAPVTGAEPGLIEPLPGATQDELRANLVWNLRAALNVAALQCDFEPTLLTVTNYNGILALHRAELATSFTTLGNYYQRTKGKGKPGQAEFDQYGTRVYSSYSTVQAQRTFCMVAGSVGRDALFAPRGKLYEVAEKRMRELRKGLTPAGEQYYGNPALGYVAKIMPLSKDCWKKGKMVPKCQAAWEARINTKAR